MNNNITPTEKLIENIPFIEEISINEALNLLLLSQSEVTAVIKKNLIDIEIVINKIINHIKINKKARIIYTGAGTSARIGVQDGAELFPTFGWPKEQVAFIIAGGLSALTNSIENAEDDEDDATKQVEQIALNTNDIVIGVAASGNTPFTLKVLEQAKLKGALTISISNNPFGKMMLKNHLQIILDSGGEILAGSTRLKAGTCQKVCLNLISTIVMARLGFVKKNMMSNMIPTNHKLRIRQIEIKKTINNIKLRK